MKNLLLLFVALGFATVSNADSTVVEAPVIKIPAPEIGDSNWTSATLTCGFEKFSFNADGTVDTELTEPNRVIVGDYDFKTWSKSDFVYVPGVSMIVAKGVLHDEPGAYDYSEQPAVHMGVVMTVDIYNSSVRDLSHGSVKVASTVFLPKTDSFKTSTHTIEDFCTFERH